LGEPPVWIEDVLAFFENLLIIVNPSFKTDGKKRGFQALSLLIGLPILVA